MILLLDLNRNHTKDIRAVAYHKTYPLFASCSDDGSANVFHGMVYSDLLQNPLIVPLKFLLGHKSVGPKGELQFLVTRIFILLPRSLSAKVVALCWFNDSLVVLDATGLGSCRLTDVRVLVVAGVMDCVFHPKQPWLFTAGADTLVKLYCN